MEASSTLVIVTILGAMFVLLASGVYVGAALALAGLVYLTLFSPVNVTIVATLWWNNTNSFVLAAIPLFILMGEIVLHTGMGSKLYEGISVWLERVPGGLAHANIASCTVFSAVSGSSFATAVTIGLVAIPEMSRRGYDRKLLFGSLAAGGTLGILIPPSLAMIIYGALVHVSVGQLFIGGILPGLVLSFLFMTYIGIRSLLQPALAPLSSVSVTWRARILALKLTGPILILIVMILGGIYTGVMTPSEAGAVGAVAAMLLALVYRKLNWQALHMALLGTLQTSCMLMFIYLGAVVLSFAVANAEIPRTLVAWVGTLNLPNIVILVCVYLLYIVMGCFLDGLSMLLMTISLVHPLIVGLGYDPVWFGVIMVVLLEMALLTPPVGLNLYVIQGISGGRPLSEVVIGAFPFFLMQCVGLVLFTAFPQIILFLPQHMIR